MSATLSPYLNFRGTAREAMTFYQSVLGGELTVTAFKDYGMPVPPEEQDLVMHAQLKLTGEVFLMGSDIPSYMPWTPGENTFSVSLFGDDHAKLTGWWDGLLAGATVQQPLEQAPWGDSFGSLVDRFGVAWIMNIAGNSTAA